MKPAYRDLHRPAETFSRPAEIWRDLEPACRDLEQASEDQEDHGWEDLGRPAEACLFSRPQSLSLCGDGQKKRVLGTR